MLHALIFVPCLSSTSWFLITLMQHHGIQRVEHRFAKEAYIIQWSVSLWLPHDRRPVAYLDFWSQPDGFYVLRGKAAFTAHIPASYLCSTRKLVWLIDNIVLDNKWERLKVYDAEYDHFPALQFIFQFLLLWHVHFFFAAECKEASMKECNLNYGLK